MNALFSRLCAAAERRSAAGLDRSDLVLDGLDLASNDYLGLSAHPLVRAAAIEEIERAAPRSARPDSSPEPHTSTTDWKLRWPNGCGTLRV